MECCDNFRWSDGAVKVVFCRMLFVSKAGSVLEPIESVSKKKILLHKYWLSHIYNTRFVLSSEKSKGHKEMKNEMTQIFFFRICHYTDDIWLGHWSNGLAISEVNISLLFNIMSIRRGTGTDIEICEIKKNFNNNWSLVTFHQNQLFGLKFPYTIR